MNQVKNFHILIEGRVQGVGFRRFAETKGKENNLKGWVRNLLDGRVEVKVSGEETQVEAFVRELQTGPSFSKVREVKISAIAEPQSLDFQIVANEEMK